VKIKGKGEGEKGGLTVSICMATDEGLYPYMEQLLKLDACRPQKTSGLPQPMNSIHTPLDRREWDWLLQRHPDQRFRSYIVEGLREGFRVGFNHSSELRRVSRNMPSATAHPEVISDYLATECSEGRVIGPLHPEQFPQVHISRFGVIPKGTTGKWRLIIDLSSPSGASVNDGVDENLCSLSYTSVWDAARGVLGKGAGALMAKVDIKHAYRNIPIHPADRVLMGMMWEGGLFINTALPFGLRSAWKIFNAVADAVEWIAKQHGVTFIIHYLDDFLQVGRPALEECEAALSALLQVFERLGLPVALEKLEGPSPRLTFLGFVVDSLRMEVCLPQQKLRELLDLLRQWLGRRSGAERASWNPWPESWLM